MTNPTTYQIAADQDSPKRTVNDMEDQERGFVVPWAIFRYRDEGLFVKISYPVKSERDETFTVPIRRDGSVYVTTPNLLIDRIYPPLPRRLNPSAPVVLLSE